MVPFCTFCFDFSDPPGFSLEGGESSVFVEQFGAFPEDVMIDVIVGEDVGQRHEQPQNNEGQLSNVRVRHGVQATEKGVHNAD